MVIRSLIPDALFAALGPATGFLTYGAMSKKSKGALTPAVVAGLATVAGTFLAAFLQQKVTGVSGLVAERVGALAMDRIAALPSVYVRERARFDSGRTRYPASVPGGGAVQAPGMRRQVAGCPSCW